MGKYKKKVDTELRTYFPGYFGDDLQYLENLRQLYLLRAAVFENGNEKDKKALDALYKYFLDASKPNCFNPYDENSVLITGEKEFEEIINAMEDGGVSGVRDSTVFEFYGKVQYLEKKVKKMKSHVS